MMRNFYIFLLLMFCILENTQAAEIKGNVYDKGTKEQMVGAYVTIKAINKNFITELDGSYALKGLAPGSYLVSVAYIGYESIDTNIQILNNGDVLKVDFYLAPSSKQLKEVRVTSKADGGSDMYAQKEEQKSISLMNIVSAHTIQISPDITVGNVMQRVSSVVVDRNASGEPQYAIIRGMDKRYNVELINGIKIASPNDQDRYLPLDIFPAELLERLEVIKSSLPSMEGDATGGTVNMVMKNAPEKLLVEANIGGGYNMAFQHQDFLTYSANSIQKLSPAEKNGPGYVATPSDFSPSIFNTRTVHTPINSIGNITLGNRFFKKKLGVIVSGSYQNIDKGVEAQYYTQVATILPVPPNAPLIQPVSDYNIRHYSYHNERLGTEAKLDYSFNSRNSLSLFATYLAMNEYRVRLTDDSTLGGYSRASGLVGPNAYHRDLQMQTTLQNIFNATLQGKHKISEPLDVDWTLAASSAAKNVPDISNYATDNPVQYNQATDALTLGTTEVGHQSREWLHNNDNDFSGYVNLHYQTDIVPTLKRIDIGAMDRNRTRTNYNNSYDLSAVSDSGQTYQKFISIPATRYWFKQNAGLGDWFSNAGSYTASENVSAYYLQLHDEIGKKIKLDGGFRVESTYQDYNSSLPVTFAGKSATYTYSDFLPSIIGKYELTPTSAIRASYFKSVNRPAFAEYIPFLDPTAFENYGFIGNDTLQHSVIDNYDLRYELFPKGLDQILVGVFYKHMQDPIEYRLYQGSFAADLSLQPYNDAPANNYGTELVFRKFWGNFGASVNYTYTKSVINVPKRLYIYDSTLPTNKTHYSATTENLPLQGQAPHIVNVSLLYKNAKTGLEGQLAFTYTGERLAVASAFKGLDTWQKPIYAVDFSIQKKFAKRFTAYLKINNLLNNGAEFFIKQHNNAYDSAAKLALQESVNYFTVEKDMYYASCLLGIRFKL